MSEISFKSYCWSIGTTSYRTAQMNLSIELQMKLMQEFRSMSKNKDKNWRQLQTAYYNFLHEREFLTGNAPRPDKDAREKTSGLVNIGLLTDERVLTEAGIKLLDLCKKGDFSSNNVLEIEEDSFIYLKQLLKTSISVNGKIVRPFIIFSYLIAKVGYLSKEEFTYFLPMCINEKSTQKIIESIKNYRDGELTIDAILFDVVRDMDNYNLALELLLESNEVTPELICKVGFNRKSSGVGKAYDIVLYSLYNIV